MKKIAIPVINGKICEHFEYFDSLFIFNLDQPNKIEKRIVSGLADLDAIPLLLVNEGVNILICRSISQRFARILNYHKIHLYVGAPLKTPEEIVSDFMEGNLVTDEKMCL